MTFHLGIDGGGTGCRAALAGEDRRVLGRGMAGPANIASDPEGALRSILTAARAALADAGLTEGELPRLRAGLGLAGANASGTVERLRAALPFASVRIETDAVAAVKGALADEDGIVAALGTGSVFGIQRGGRVRQIGGWGLVLGDEGSGAWIGRALLSRALRAVDGFVPMTALLREVVAEHGGPEGVVTFSLGAKPVGFARFAPRVMESSDPAALAIMGRATADVAEAVDLLQAGEGLPVVLLGGLGPAYAERLAGRWTLRPPRGSALDGALWLAYEGAGP
ncbi:N-acetylglucosamine kinase of eukaryotic type [Rubellimicrobium mesophilum DSM 19309]|uniref:N-acetylglucosamine kinase of eukaryotic type n=1 Tax=Rubellimicrobium mesophilum DSM 19309 TaxID=442562 RepID=A0A017HQB9_9RHOB|nr:BadF/BadG/BcrA/BcrD ATPase family protein [Rubellimicrobium mesophilum]EYD76697.1 N-acetylglucosamine kinase of eukaryotic type [Rubellimicrobium mesophilum DSM 19309]